MKKITLVAIACIFALVANAVPAKRVWRTVTQPDGTTIEVMGIGDEFYHYMINKDGKEVRRAENGFFEVVGEAPSAEKISVRRAKGQARRQRKDVGITPNPAPKGIVILANFSDLTMKSGHTVSVFDEMCNSENCTVNAYNGVKYPSAAEYFKSQSNGVYRPQFDVFGPVNLSKGYAYYGGDNDAYATDAVIEACILANNKYPELNFKNYDSDNDGYVDFVYVIYAGYGEAETWSFAPDYIWPHNYSIQTVVSHSGWSKYKKANTYLDSVYLDNYAMSNEIEYYNNDALTGIGTLCHEFGHVIGLPDFYDTNANEEATVNSSNMLTPNSWDVMDGGAYNGDGHCPPNYSPWEKYFFGWHTPINLGTTGRVISDMKANGVDGYQAYQVNTSGTQQTPTTAGECYFIENRQQQGWDRPLTAHGMLIWKVNFNASAWQSNTPNNTDNAPKYTIVSRTGTKIGASGDSDYSANNVFPGSGTTKKTSVTIANKPILEIAETSGKISFIYIEEPPTVDPFDVEWYVDGTLVETNQCTGYGTVVLPTTDPEGCNNREFMGWCADASYSSATTAPTFVKTGDAVTEGAKFYAIFATKGEGSAEETKTYTFTSKSWADATNSWTSYKDGNQLTSGQGVQITTGCTGASAYTKASFDQVSKVVVTYCTNASKGAGKINVAVGDGTAVSKDVTKTGGTTLRTLEYTFAKESGQVKFSVTCTTNSIYVNSVAITAGGGVSYSNYSTAKGCDATGIEDAIVDRPAATKVIRDGHIVIIRGDEEFTITGERIR